MASLIYRGYDLNEIQPGKWVIQKDGHTVNVGLGSEEAAQNWVDQKKREEAQRQAAGFR